MICKFSLSKSSCRGIPFCNTIKVLKLPEFSLLVDVSGRKVVIYFMLLIKFFEHKPEGNTDPECLFHSR